MKEFCRKLPTKEEYRLPREAEWEYACRGGSQEYTAFHYGDALSSTQANFDGNYPFGGAAKGSFLERTERVGSYKPNGYGLYDMHGNVWEWCEDWYAKDTYQAGKRLDPVGPSEGSSRVVRGGSWSFYAGLCRSAYRYGFTPDFRFYFLGFRLARSFVE